MWEILGFAQTQQLNFKQSQLYTILNKNCQLLPLIGPVFAILWRSMAKTALRSQGMDVALNVVRFLIRGSSNLINNFIYINLALLL
jgi:hypothetical protein